LGLRRITYDLFLFSFAEKLAALGSRRRRGWLGAVTGSIEARQGGHSGTLLADGNDDRRRCRPLDAREEHVQGPCLGYRFRAPSLGLRLVVGPRVLDRVTSLGVKVTQCQSACHFHCNVETDPLLVIISKPLRREAVERDEALFSRAEHALVYKG
jgi:hypothetical protein